MKQEAGPGFTCCLCLRILSPIFSCCPSSPILFHSFENILDLYSMGSVETKSDFTCCNIVFLLTGQREMTFKILIPESNHIVDTWKFY